MFTSNTSDVLPCTNDLAFDKFSARETRLSPMVDARKMRLIGSGVANRSYIGLDSTIQDSPEVRNACWGTTVVMLDDVTGVNVRVVWDE